MINRLKNLAAWARDSQNLHAIGAVLGALAAIYESLHKAGVL